MAHICQYLSIVASRHPDRPLFTCEDSQRTAAQVLQRVAALATCLRQQHGIAPGDRVLLAGHNTDMFLEALLAITAVGAIAAPLNWRWSTVEAADAAMQCKAKLLLHDSACASFAALANSSRCPTLRGARLLSVEGPGSGAIGSTMEPLLHNQDAAAVICFTSGTTGRPKGVLVSHTAFHCQAAAKLLVVGYNSDDVYLHTAPLFHIGGLSSAVAMLMAGGRHIFAPRFSAAGAVALIRRHSVTATIAVPAMVADLAAAAGGGAPAAALDSVQRLLVGAGGMSAALQQQLRRLFPNAALLTAYGMTEACSSMTFQMLQEPARTGQRVPSTEQGVCVGRPPAGIEMAVLPAGTEAGPGAAGLLHSSRAGAEGEVVTRGPHTLLRYWGMPAETAAVCLPGSWLRTGDMGSIDGQGQVWLRGRVKDTIRSGGETVHASEVENVLASHLAVRAVAVVGMPHCRLGEQVTAVVQLQPGWAWTGPQLPGQMLQQAEQAETISLEALQQHCRQAGLSPYKLPRAAFATQAPLPMNASGKVLKHQLKQLLSKQLSRM
eukprot:jgi/Astpho2/1619/fgenesh1_pm.00028_%23_11_t